MFLYEVFWHNCPKVNCFWIICKWPLPSSGSWPYLENGKWQRDAVSFVWTATCIFLYDFNLSDREMRFLSCEPQHASSYTTSIDIYSLKWTVSELNAKNCPSRNCPVLGSRTAQVSNLQFPNFSSTDRPLPLCKLSALWLLRSRRRYGWHISVMQKTALPGIAQGSRTAQVSNLQFPNFSSTYSPLPLCKLSALWLLRSRRRSGWHISYFSVKEKKPYKPNHTNKKSKVQKPW